MVLRIDPPGKWDSSCLSCNERNESLLLRMEITNDTTKQQVWGGCICRACWFNHAKGV